MIEKARRLLELSEMAPHELAMLPTAIDAESRTLAPSVARAYLELRASAEQLIAILEWSELSESGTAHLEALKEKVGS